MPGSLQPYQYTRRILLCVTGKSPQIVTETLYALAVTQIPPFIPTEVHLLTTTDGAEEARIQLLHPDNGYFSALLKDWPQIGQPRFDENTIHVISDKQGLLSDIRTPDDNIAAADTITALVAQFTADTDAALHVSIAGGRKTMGFYLGYAFSLFARPQDTLSHILISPLFENHPDFFYPPPQPRYLVTRDKQFINTADAVITLTEIPVVHLRHGLPDELVSGKAGYSETVAAVQKSFAPPYLLIDIEHHRITCGEKIFTIQPQLFAWLTWWAIQAKQRKPYTSWFEADFELFLDIYKIIVGVDASDYEKTAELLINSNKIEEQEFRKEFFQTKNAKMEHALKNKLGTTAASYLLTTIGKRPHTQRGLSLPPDCIHINGIACLLLNKYMNNRNKEVVNSIP